MALTRNDGVIACIVSLLAWAVGVRWLPILRYATYAFLAGAVTTLVSIGALILLTSRSPAFTRPKSSTRTPSFIAYFSATEWESKSKRVRNSQSDYTRVPLYPPDPGISEALDEILELILRDQVIAWYRHISHCSSFTNAVDSALRTALASLRDKLLAVDLVEITVSKIVPLLTDHLRELYEVERTVRGDDLKREVTESDQLDLAIAGKYKAGQLHPAASMACSDPTVIQQEHLRVMVGKIMPVLLPPDQRRSRAVEVLVREIVACAVLLPLVQMLSDPDFWNQMMESYGRTMLQDRKTVRRLRAALDEHASPAPKSRRGIPFPRLAPHDSERKYERFMRGIRNCSNISDAKRFRSEVSSQLNRDSRVEAQDPVHLKRLEAAKELLDQRVLSLTNTNGGAISRTGLTQPTRSAASSRVERATMSEILCDASGLSYFMEFMDRRGLITLVQFWIVVEGLRNPLEEHVPDEDYFTAAPSTWTESDRGDLAHIFEAYMSKAELKVTGHTREVIGAFFDAGPEATQNQYLQARQAILGAQAATLKGLETRYLPKFRESDLFYKYLTADEAAVANRSDSPTPTTRKVPPRAASQANIARAALSAREGPSRARTPGKHLLRRAAASSAELGVNQSLWEEETQARRSLDGQAIAFEGDVDTDDAMSGSRNSIDSDPTSLDQAEVLNHKVVEVMEAVLSDIMVTAPDDDPRSFLFGPVVSKVRAQHETLSSSSSSSFLSPSVSSGHQVRDPLRPSIASLGLVNTASRIGVFEDDDLFGDEQKFVQDEHEDPSDASDGSHGSTEDIHLAAPGDLGLTEAIFALTNSIERLTAQESVVDTLTRKAELTANTAELRILRKSKASLQREIRREELQRQQYIVQECDNSLYGRSTVRISSIIVSTESATQHEYASYVIEVQRKAGEQMPAATWSVARRYSEFHELQQRLRAKYANVRHLDFPRRRMVMKLQRDFLQRRRAALEHYLAELLLLPNVCRSRDLRAFLSQATIITAGPATHPESDLTSSGSLSAAPNDMMTRIYSTISDSVDDLLGNIPALSPLSLAGQNLLASTTTASSSSSFTNGGVPTTSLISTTTLLPTSLTEDPLNAEAEAELNAFVSDETPPPRVITSSSSSHTPPTTTNTNTPTTIHDNNNNNNNTNTTPTTNPDPPPRPQPLVKPIADLFLELFSLTRGANWLRGRAAVLILHQLLGGTIQKRVRALADTLLGSDSVLRALARLREMLVEREGSAASTPSTTTVGVSSTTTMPSTVPSTTTTTTAIPIPQRSAQDKARSRREAGVMLEMLVLDLAGGVVGRANAGLAGRRLRGVMGNGILLQEMVWRVVDVGWGEVFGELAVGR